MILHVDLDAFYASVEQRDNPALRGKPVLVGSPSARAVVLAASYEARPFGCRSAMAMATARRLCPQAIVAPPRPSAYSEASHAFLSILETFTPLVEPISIDEAFLDVRGSQRLYGAPEEIARKIKARVQSELKLVASIGVAPIKFVAKIASDISKPDGLRVITDVKSFLEPLPIEKLYGVGPKTAKQLHGRGITTVGQLARYPSEAWLAELQALARGEDPREVVPDRQAKAIGAEETFEEDLGRGPELERHLLAQSERVAERLRRAGLVARTVTLKLKDTEFKILTRRRTLPAPTSDTRVIVECARTLLHETSFGLVRLSGVSASGLDDANAPRQLTLDEPERRRGDKVEAALDKIRDKFGESSVERADLLDPDRDRD